MPFDGGVDVGAGLSGGFGRVLAAQGHQEVFVSCGIGTVEPGSLGRLFQPPSTAQQIATIKEGKVPSGSPLG